MKSVLHTVALAILALTACHDGGKTVAAPDAEASMAMQSSSVSVVSTPPPHTQAEIDAGAETFMQAISSDNPDLLAAYYDIPPEKVDVDFAHITLRKIVADAPVSAKELWRDGDRFSVLFYQTRFKGQISQSHYQQTQYLKSFFVCNFTEAKGRWKVANPVLCYDETEGPYERAG